MDFAKYYCLCALVVFPLALTTRVEVGISQLQTLSLADKLAKKGLNSSVRKSSVLEKMGSPVCSASETEPVGRYVRKSASLREDAAKMRTVSEMTGGATLKLMYDLTKRVRDFESCAHLLVHPTTNQSAELQKVMGGGLAKETSLISVITGALADLSAGIKHFGFFKDDGVCGFYPESVNFEAAFKTASPAKAMEQQLFGTGCSVLDSIVYVGHLRKQEQKMIFKMVSSIHGLVQVNHVSTEDSVSTEDASTRQAKIQQIENSAKLVIHEQLPIDSLEIGTEDDIDALFEDWSQRPISLLELSTSDDSEHQEIFAMAVFIGLMCIGLAIIMWVFVPMAADR